jgi:hypothetical protein
MIILGLETAAHRDPDTASPLVTEALSEAVAWCALQRSQSHLFRSTEIDPSTNLNFRAFPKTREEIEIWIQDKYLNYQQAVSEVIQQRSELLRATNVRLPEIDAIYPKGKLLIYFPMETVTDGAAEASSHRFFDGEDAPPWDTWFWYSKGAILCWVDGSMTSAAQAGIDANPVDCIQWADWDRLALLVHL